MGQTFDRLVKRMCLHCPSTKELPVSQDGVELGVYMKEAIEAAGKPFQELSPEEIGAALRKYEIQRSHRVAHIVGKSGMMGNLFMVMGYLVSSPAVCSLPQHCLQNVILLEPIDLPPHVLQHSVKLASQDGCKYITCTVHIICH